MTKTLNELSKGTLGRYIKRSAQDMADTQADGTLHGKKRTRMKREPEYRKKYAGYQKKYEKREKGIARATDRLTKEDVEVVDELSRGTMARYTAKSINDRDQRRREIIDRNVALNTGRSRAGHSKTAHWNRQDRKKIEKRSDGISTALKKLAKEDVSEAAATERGLEDHEPRTVEGVKGMKSAPFKKHFKNSAAQDKWEGSDDYGNHDVHRVYRKEEIDVAGKNDEIDEGKVVLMPADERIAYHGRMAVHHKSLGDAATGFAKTERPDHWKSVAGRHYALVSAHNRGLKEAEELLDESPFGLDRYSHRVFTGRAKHTLEFRGKAVDIHPGDHFHIRPATSQAGMHRVVVPHMGKNRVMSVPSHEGHFLRGASQPHVERPAEPAWKHRKVVGLGEQEVDEGSRGRPRKDGKPNAGADDTDQHIISQLRKATNLGGTHKVVFGDGSSSHVHPHLAKAALAKHGTFQKPDDKEAFQNRLHKSKTSFHQAVGEAIQEQLEEAKKDKDKDGKGKTRRARKGLAANVFKQAR